MSSFVISKKAYMRCAGLLAGIAEGTARFTHKFWLWDYTNNRNMIAEDYRREFEKCYQMNALSVQEQYHDDSPETDTNDYKEDFKEYCMQGRKAALNKAALLEWIPKVQRFFNSALYQTEKDAYFWQMQMLFGRIIMAMVSLANTSKDLADYYGSFGE